MRPNDIGFSHCLSYSGFERKIYMLVISGSVVRFRSGWVEQKVL